MKHADPVDRAFELLRGSAAEPAPDGALEARLRTRFRPRPRRLQRLPALLVGGALVSGAAFAASGGIEWVRGWWYAVEVEGHAVEGAVGDDGERNFAFQTDDGDAGTVRIRRDHTDEGQLRTRVDIDRTGPDGVVHEQAEDVFGPRVHDRYPISELDHAEVLYETVDAAGEPCSFFALSSGIGGSRLLLLQEEYGSDRPVTELARLPFDLLADGCRMKFVERGDGGLLISAASSGEEEAAFEFVWTRRAAATTPRPTELETQDGSVRVRVENADDRR